MFCEFASESKLKFSMTFSVLHTDYLFFYLAHISDSSDEAVDDESPSPPHYKIFLTSPFWYCRSS